MNMTSSRKPIAMNSRAGCVASGDSPPLMPVSMFTANARDAVVAEVIPEHITVNSTMKVMKWTPKALCTYRAAPAAWGYLVTSSR